MYHRHIEAEGIYHFNEMVNQDIIDPDEQLYVDCLACFKQVYITDDTDNVHFSKHLQNRHNVDYNDLKL